MAGSTPFGCAPGTQSAKALSEPSSPIRLPDVPSAPRGLKATREDRAVSLTFPEPTESGGAPITGYALTRSDSVDVLTSGPSTRALRVPATNGVPTTFSLRAVNRVGEGPAARIGPLTAASTPAPPVDIVAVDPAGRPYCGRGFGWRIAERRPRAPTASSHPRHPALLWDAEIKAAVADVADVWPVPPALIRAVIRQESANNPRAVSPAGAKGLMQLMPATAVKVGVAEKELFTPARNILADVRLLAALLRHYEGDVVSALVVYNSGPKTKAQVPSNGETPEYVSHIFTYWREFDSSVVARPSPRRL